MYASLTPLQSKLYEAKTSGEPHIKLSVYSPPNLTRPTFSEATSHYFKPTHTGASFGPSWSTHWIKVQLTLPTLISAKEHLEFHWDAGNEGLIWSEDGIPLQGLTGNGERVEWILPKEYRDGQEHTFYVEMACNGMFGVGMGGNDIMPPDPDRYFKIKRAEVVAVNLQARGLKVDFWIIGGEWSIVQDIHNEMLILSRCCSRISRGLLGRA
jgi:alpha-mannosidase